MATLTGKFNPKRLEASFQTTTLVGIGGTGIIPLSTLAVQAAWTVVANATSGSATPTAVAATGTGTPVLNTSPTLVTAVLGSSTATTQSAGDNSTKVSTTAFVHTEIAATAVAAPGIRTIPNVTDSPGFVKIDVRLDLGVSGGTTFTGGTDAGDSTTYVSTSSAAKGKHIFGTSAYDEANNRWGIGTTSPSVPLDVVGAAVVTVTSGTAYLASVTANPAIFDGRRINAASAAATTGNSLVALRGLGYDGVSAYSVAGSIAIFASAVHSATSSPGYMSFSTVTAATTMNVERMRIDSLGNLSIGATLGVGAAVGTVPTATVDVTGSVKVSTTLDVTGASTFSALVTVNVTTGGAYLAHTVAVAPIYDGQRINAASAAVAVTNTLVTTRGLGWDTAAYVVGGSFSMVAGETFSASARGSYATINVCAIGATTNTERMRVAAAAVNVIPNTKIGGAAGDTPAAALEVVNDIVASTTIRSTGATSGVGYAAGAGGSVTQITSRATASPAINKMTGKIATDNSSIANNAAATFVVTNSAIGTNDVVILNVLSVSTGSVSDWEVYPAHTIVNATSFSISYRNQTGGNSTAILTFSFAIIKGVIT